LSVTLRSWRRYATKLVALEISALTRYYDRLIQYERLPHDDGLLFDTIECKSKSVVYPGGPMPDASAERDCRTAVLLNGNCNHSTDIQGILERLKPSLSRSSRVILVVYNPYLGWFFRLANRFGLRAGEAPTTFITSTDLTNVARLSGFRLVRSRAAVYSPFRLAGIGSVFNALLPAVPLLRNLGLVGLIVLAPVAEPEDAPSISIVIPARNERGNIVPALEGLRAEVRNLPGLEVILVEGHSTDGTWEEMQRVIPEYSRDFKIAVLRQEGKGKGDAVRLGLARATGDVLTILDADLTVPPAALARFYEAYRVGHGEFVNGSRLVYGTEAGAMRFLNRLGNVLFAKALSRVLSVRLGDSLCGTKLFARHDYARFTAWRKDFGDFDPFGDFELLFPAAVLGLTIVDVPIRYGARSYGKTNISRFRHGWMLAKMTAVGFFKVRLGIVG
jgi:Glycosyl transferase family 2